MENASVNPYDPNAPVVGFCTSILGHRHSLTAAKIRALAAAGARRLELACLQQLHLDVFDAERLGEVGAAVEETGLKVWSLHAPFCGFAMDDADTRTDGVRLLARSMEAARQFGARFVVVHPGRDVPIVDRRRELAWTRDAMARAADMAPEGVAAALETMGAASLGGTAEEMLAVLDGLDPARAGICFDTGHVHQGADVPGFIRQVGRRILTVHLHDNHGQRDEHALPGRGTIDWPAALTALRDTGYRGVLMCEAGDPNLDLAATIADFTDHMRTSCRQAFGSPDGLPA
ncbi:MAG: sugar phosphate isomerase/epimerase [Planctomycetes bacterium]|nr:sugar phosphate isomerase/epimerase [Planctomycetota bacterium]